MEQGKQINRLLHEIRFPAEKIPGWRSNQNTNSGTIAFLRLVIGWHRCTPSEGCVKRPVYAGGKLQAEIRKLTDFLKNATKTN